MVAEIKSEMLFTARNTNIILENAKNKSMIQIIQLKHLKQVGVKYIEYLHTVCILTYLHTCLHTVRKKGFFAKSLHFFDHRKWLRSNQSDLFIYHFIV